jgi:lipid-A-disaccharide synthase
MKPATIMVVVGDPSGDANAAELVKALAGSFPQARFIGAGGPKMAEAGVALSFNLTDDAVIGPADVLAKIGLFWRRFRALVELASEQKPDLVILVDFYTFNQRLAHAIKKRAGRQAEWQPKIVQYTSPQVWASRPWRAEKLAKDIDLLLCLFPFEKEWYARRGTNVRVEYVGHPMLDQKRPSPALPAGDPLVVLLPGSRRGELKRHLPVMLEAAREIAASAPVRFKLITPNESLADYARSFHSTVEIQSGHLTEALSAATVAIASTGTVTLECAFHGVPTVALYKTSASTYLLARSLITVKYLAMPNLLANEPLFPEFIQGEATSSNVANATLALLGNAARRGEIQAKLAQVIASLGGPGSIQRANAAIRQLMDPLQSHG